MLNKAIILATTYHANQVDKCGQPYIFHSLRVMLNPTLTTENERIVAVLHDVIEDTNCPIDSLKEFSREVQEALVAISHIKNEPQEVYLSRVKDNPLALAVKFADIADNLSPARMKNLTIAERERITNKHNEALSFLMMERKVD